MKKPSILETSSQGIPIVRKKRTENLLLNMQRQEQDNWCWSAVATSVSLHYYQQSGWTQCELVNEELVETTCCQNGNSKICDKPWYLEKALQRTGNLENWNIGNVPFEVIKQRIDNEKVIGARIGWEDGGGHFVVIDGYNDNSDQFISIRDPLYGSSTYSFDSFKDAYLSSGSWTHTYSTKP